MADISKIKLPDGTTYNIKDDNAMPCIRARIPYTESPQAGWRRICKINTGINGYQNGFVEITGGWNNGMPSNAIIAINCIHTFASMTLLSNLTTNGIIQKVRLVNISGEVYWFDAYMVSISGMVSDQWFIFDGNFSISDIQNSSDIITESVTPTYELSLTDALVYGTLITSNTIGSQSVNYATSAGSATDNTKLPLAGGTMSGQIKTSFKSSVATGSQQADASTIPDLCTELRYSSGVMGSVSISTSYTKDGVTIATGWYNFLWVPHRSGGVNGQASGDNCDYGSLYLSGMTTSGCYMLRFANGNIAELKDLYKDTNTTYALSTSGNNVVLTPSSGSANTITVPYATNAGSATDNTKMPLAGGTFTGIVTHNKSIHGSSGETIYGAEARRSQWYKLTLATNGLTPPASNRWYMCSFNLNMAGDYSNTPKGSIYVSYYIYWNGSAFSADKVFATAFGNNMDKVAVYYKLTNPFILYIDSSNAYSAIWIDKISYRDSGDGYRTRDTVLETTSAITTSEYSSIPISCFYTYDGSQLYTNKSLLPDGNNALNLGSTTKKWANGYFTNINGVTVGDSPKFTDNNTTYTLSASGNNIVLTPSSGSANTITVPYATDAGKVNNLTVQTAVPANAEFTDTKVTQTPTTDNHSYEVLLSGSTASLDADTTKTEGVYKNSALIYNPQTNALVVRTNSNLVSTDYSQVQIRPVEISLRTQNAKTRVILESSGLSMRNNDGTKTIGITSSSGDIETTGNIEASAITATSLNGATIGSSPKFTDTHRTVKIDSSEVLGDNTTPLNLISGTGIRLGQWAGSGGSGIVIDATGPSVTDISTQYTFHKTSGPWTVQEIRAVRSGNVVTMQLVIKGGSAVSAGSNGIVGTLSGGPLPAKVNGGTQDIITSGVCYYGNSALVGTLTSSGSFVLRLLINNQSLGSSTTSMCFTFVCD